MRNIIPFRINRRFLWQILVAIALLLSLLQVLYGIGKVLLSIELIDFSVYFGAVKSILAFQNPYTQLFGSDKIPFNYPPSFLLFFYPFSIIPVNISQLFFTISSIIALFLTVYIFIKSVLLKTQWYFLLLLFCAFLQNFPTKFTLTLGQVNLIVLFFLSLVFYFDQKKRKFLSGIFFGLAILVKLTPLSLSLYFILKKKWSILFTGLSVAIGANLIVLYIYPNTGYFFSSLFYKLLFPLNTNTSVYDQSLRAFIFRTGMDLNFSVIFTFLLLLLTLFKHILLVIKKKQDRLQDLNLFSLILGITSIGNSFAWQHHFVYLFPGCIYAFIIFLKKKKPVMGIMLFLSLILISIHFPDISNPPTTHPLLLSHTLIGALILIFMLLLN